MRRYNIFIFLVLCLIAPFTALANISVYIADAPDNVLLYSPIYILGVVQNIGDKTVLVAMNRNQFPGLFLEVSSSNTHLTYSPDYEGDHSGDDVLALAPGEKHYFLEEIGADLTGAGVYEARVFLAGNGQCEGTGTETFPVELLPESKGRDFPLFKCWAGKVSSEPIKFLVSLPTNLDDIKALDYVVSGKAFLNRGKVEEIAKKPHTPTRDDFSFSYLDLKTNFQNSYYTYISGLYAASRSEWGSPIGTLEDIMKLQPDHPLERFTKTLWARSVISDSLRMGPWGKIRARELENLTISVDLKAYLAEF